MTYTAPWKNGLALGLTLGVGYTLCSVAYLLWPTQGISFMNALFHGLDFRQLVTATPFTLSDFLLPLAVFVVWGFLIGTLYAWLQQKLSACNTSS